MFVVITHPLKGRQAVFGPFLSHLSAADFAHEHYDQSGEATEVRPLSGPITYGDEGL